jgi:hypothetical protein
MLLEEMIHRISRNKEEASAKHRFRTTEISKRKTPMQLNVRKNGNYISKATSHHGWQDLNHKQ